MSKRKAEEVDSESSKKQKSDDVKLGRSVRPQNYDVALVPNFSTFTFQGDIDIQVEVSEKVEEITLHAVDLTLHSATIKSNSAEQKASSITLDAKSETATFTFAQPIQTGNYVLNIKFDGVLNDKLCGFYRSKYTTPSGEEKYMACTQFEATDARRAIPCWDEPAVKATFDVTLVVPSHTTAVSNMPVILKATTKKSDGKDSESRGLVYGEGNTLYRYARSPVMSTYLLAFVVGEFDYITATTKSRVEVRIYTPVSKTHLGIFALDVATRALEFFESWFGVPYPLPKVDLLGIPDFAAGAMENWGCITYREIRLLVDAKNSSAAIKQQTARTICHELAHMWFGNLVTMDWWTNLWLNEGFARFMEHLAVNHLFPEWDIWTQFVSDVFSQALTLDSLLNSHPVEVPVKHPSEINEIFDTISYAKGASVIKMLQSTIGEADFQKGLQLYLSRFAYKNARTEDLWQALSEVSKKDVSTLMSNWVKKIGYPYLTFTSAGESNGQVVLNVQQNRFLASASETKEETLWNVPIKIEVYDSKNKSIGVHSYSLTKDQDQLHVPIKEKGQYIKVNPKHASFFRTHYDEKLITPLAFGVSSKSLPAVDRLGLLIDSFALAQIGHTSIAQVMTLVESYKEEHDFSVVRVLCSSLGSLCRIHGEQSYYPLLQKFIGELFEPAFLRLGWKAGSNEDSLTPQLRSQIISMMGLSGDKRVIEEARKLLDLFLADEEKNPIPADLRYVVYHLSIKYGGEEAWNKVLSIYRKYDFSEERRRVLSAIGHSKESAILKKTLEWGVGSGEVRTQDIPFVFGSVAGSPAGRQLAWQYLKDNWTTLSETYSKGQNFLIANIINSTISDFTKVSDAENFEAFFKANSCPSADRTIKQCSELVRANAARLTREQSDLQTWLNRKK